jgi:hypothetical protein
MGYFVCVFVWCLCSDGAGTHCGLYGLEGLDMLIPPALVWE